MDDIGDTLAEFVRQHPEEAAGASRVIDVAGQIDPNEPEPIQQFRRQLRRLGREYSTEKGVRQMGSSIRWALRGRHDRPPSIVG